MSKFCEIHDSSSDFYKTQNAIDVALESGTNESKALQARLNTILQNDNKENN